MADIICLPTYSASLYTPCACMTLVIPSSSTYLCKNTYILTYLLVSLNREENVMNYLNQTKCKCGHFYDFGHEGQATEKYFYKPTHYQPWWLDRAKIFQMDPMEDFIKGCVADALRSESTPVS